ncbi:TonB-dependent receptor [Sphingomonas sp. LY160]|uniref:TonB-dependent receptor n=1 Tax=Sphingomonas sp. LY160 TaxID=3095342 RepID=UPI002ADEC180|nr:TonB-dependent receptor [Sphingomonas sp. LY160]MEA1072977.1 TonB-dependent receptor [Sphingomonas sp. LY160]
MALSLARGGDTMIETFVTIVMVGVAAPAPPPPVEAGAPVEEIVVTGERVPRSLRETASSVAVITAGEIEARPADRVDQLLASIPNVQPGSGTEGPAIRGQDSTGVVRELFAFLGGTRPRATLTVDGRAVTFNEYISGAASLWDVERIEVFRSPQTTTQGRNSIAGGIFVNTNDPSDTPEARGRASVGNYGSRQASALVSGPILRDQLAIRVAGDLKLGRNSSDMADAIAGADLKRDDHGMVRVKLLAQPDELPGVRFEASYVHVGSKAPQFEAVAFPFKDRRSPAVERTVGVIRTNIDSVTAQLDVPLGNSLMARSTVSHGDGRIRRFGLPGLGNTRNNSQDYSGETVLRWRPNAPLKMLGGVHFFALGQRQSIDITGLRIGTGGFRDKQRSVGFFGEAEWRPIPRVTLTAGLRYQRDAQDRSGQVGPVGPGITVDYDESFAAWLPKLSLAYTWREKATVGLLVQRAYNPGGTTVNLATRAQDNFDAEQLWNYELFFRAPLLRNRLMVSANLFDNQIENAQRPQTIEFVTPDGVAFNTTEIANAPKARARGAEIGLAYRASSNLSLRMGLGILDTRIQRTLSPSDPILGKQFQRSPRVSAAAAFDWRPIAPLRLSAQMRAGSAYFSDDANTPSRRIDGSISVDARAAYTRGKGTLFGYVRNAFDNFYLTHLFTPTLGTAADPREFGVGIEAAF